MFCFVLFCFVLFLEYVYICAVHTLLSGKRPLSVWLFGRLLFLCFVVGTNNKTENYCQPAYLHTSIPASSVAKSLCVQSL
jgi:hypothetical protein